MFTQRHFVAIATTLKAMRDSKAHLTGIAGQVVNETIDLVVSDMVTLFEDDNERFDVKRFVKASGGYSLQKIRARDDALIGRSVEVLPGLTVTEV